MGGIRSQYDEIKRVLQEHDMQWVENQYKKIKEHAIKNTDYYASYSTEDTFPVVNKTILNERKTEFMAKGDYLPPLHYSSTSGSTGTPFTVAQDYKKRSRTIADLKVFGELADYPSHERMIFFRVLSAKLHRTPEQEDRENIYYIDSSDLSETKLSQMIESIIDYKPRTVFSYASVLTELGKYIERERIALFPFLRSILVGGEGISEENRSMLERVFGCKVFRRYSDMELGILGQDSGDGKVYSLNWGSYYFECLKLDSDEPAQPGEIGRIVITDLFNYAFPMIRYDTGDLGIMEEQSGAQLPVYTEIFGRKRDCIYSTDGRLLAPSKVSVLMWGIGGVKQWQFIQYGQKQYKMRLNADRVSLTEISSRLKSALGADAEIEYEFVSEIPILSSNKRRAVICDYQPKEKI